MMRTKTLSKKLYVPAILAIILVVLMSASGKANDEPESATPQHPYRGLVHKGEYDKAEPIIRAMLTRTKKDESDRWQLVVDLAAVQRMQGQAKSALKTIETLAAADRDRPDTVLEIARCHLASKDVPAAERLLKLLQGNASVEPRCFANFEVAKLDFDAERFEPCIKLCERVIQEASKIDLYQHPHQKEIRDLLVDARKLLAEAKDCLIANRFGEDYALYRKARIAQAQGDYAKAIEFYRQIKAPVLSDAAGCYVPACVAAMGNVLEAAQLYQRFTKTDPFGLYRGEALYELARLKLLNASSQSDLQSAQKGIEQALRWFNEVQKNPAPAQIDALKAVLNEFPLPKEVASVDQMGNYYRNHVKPENIINRLTCKWYLPQLGMQTRLLQAFVLNEMGDRKGTADAVEAVLASNTSQGGHMIHHDGLPRRLAWDAKDGAFLVPPEVWSVVSPAYALRVHLGAYLTVAGERVEAARLFESILTTASNPKPSLEDRAIAEFGLACLDFASYREEAAMKRLVKFADVYLHTQLAPLARIVRGNILIGQRGGVPFAVKQYMEVIEQYPATPYAPQALLSLAVGAYNAGELSIAREAAERLLNTYRNAAQTPAARTLLRVMFKATANSTAAEDVSGEIVAFNRHMVIPGDSGPEIDIEPLQSNDLVKYDLSYAVRSGCSIAHFRLWLTMHEPQVVAQDTEKEMSFIRVPFLVKQ